MDKMFKTIEEVQLLLSNLIPDSYMAVGGSFALYVAGIPLDHEPHDLDINWYVDIEDFSRAHRDLKAQAMKYGFAISSSRGQAVAFRINGITVDVFIYDRMAKHTLLENSGIKYLSVGDVMNYKLLYGREKDKKCIDYIYEKWSGMVTFWEERYSEPVIIRTEFPEGIVEGVHLSDETREFLNNARSFDDLVDRVIIAAGVKGIHIESKTLNPLGYQLKFYTDITEEFSSEIVVDILNNGLPF